jgi:DUF3040 family protein
VLSDRERETLHEIQCRLLVEDPGFAQSFDASKHRLLRGPRWRHRAYTVGIVVAVMLCVLMLMSQSPGTALAFAAMTGWLFMARRGRLGTSQRGT